MSLSSNRQENEDLKALLLSTLDEKVFFGHLSSYFSSFVPADRILVYRVKDDGTSELICENGKPREGVEIISNGEGSSGLVIRTKRPYFSNNVARDPLLGHLQNQGVLAELSIPVASEGIIIATIHFRMIANQYEYSREDINRVLGILGEIKRPLENIKLYLAAKYLNETLLRQVMEKEKELNKRTESLNLVEEMIISEGQIIGQSELLRNLIKMADKVADAKVNLLVEGGPGTGKELLARRIHCRSSSAKYPFLVVDASNLSEDALEQELFGVEYNDFSRNMRVKLGIFEKANGGTVLIKEIGRLGPRLQGKIFNFIREGHASRVNGSRPFRSGVRIISTSISRLKEQVDLGKFREDLFYALTMIELRVPDLVDRIEDLEILAHYFLNIGRSREDQKSFSPEAFGAMKEYHWPGNIRELQGVINRAYILSEGRIIEKQHLPDAVLAGKKVIEAIETPTVNFFEMTLEELEKHHICQTLEHLGGNKTKTAKTLGITVKTLYNKLHTYGLICSKEA